MSRSGYTEDADNDWQLHLWRGQVASAMRGNRGQKLLHDLLEALDAMPDKRLIKNEFWNGEACALGVLGVRRGVDVVTIDTKDYDGIAATFGVARQVVMEIEFMNDDGGSYCENPEKRWTRMRAWVFGSLKENQPSSR